MLKSHFFLNHIYEYECRVTLAKTQKRNWYQEDIVLLLWIVRKYCSFKNKHPDSLVSRTEQIKNSIFS